MSATLDSDRLEAYLRPCTVLRAEGRVHPVAIQYAGVDDTTVWERAARAYAAHASGAAEGHTLVFMPGAYEIGRTIEALRALPEAAGRAVLPLHGDLPPAEQDAAVARGPRPRVIVSTNVAETSLTIEGVRLVIDSGLARIPGYDAVHGVDMLTVEPISRASADQRAGRAGRTGPGVCVRLWAERDHARRSAREAPEVVRVDLCEAVLLLKAAGVEDLRSYRWLDAPEDVALRRAEDLLVDLGALRQEGETTVLTPLGRRMLAFPLHPRYSRMLLAADGLGCVPEAARVAALTQGREILQRGGSSFRETWSAAGLPSDFLLLLRAWEHAAERGFREDACRRAGIHAQAARQVAPVAERFLAIARREGLDTRARASSDEALRKCILIGFPDRVARRLDPARPECRMVHQRSGALARESVVQEHPLFVAAELREAEGRGRAGKTILGLATAIDASWLRDLFPEDMGRDIEVRWDAAAKRVIAEEVERFRDLAIDRRRVETPPLDQAARLLAAEVLAGRLKLDHWTPAADQWLLRVNLIARTCPELGISAIGQEDLKALVEDLCHGAVAFREIKDRPVLQALRSWLDPAGQELVDRHAPERIVFPGGRKGKVTYIAEGPPYVAMRIQELFGVTQVPRIAMGRVAPLVHILAPNHRPVQVTQDLAGFWREHYPRVKRELQRRYPKHEWR